MQKLLLTFLSVSLFYYSNAQTEIDALRYSKSDIVGTAHKASGAIASALISAHQPGPLCFLVSVKIWSTHP